MTRPGTGLANSPVCATADITEPNRDAMRTAGSVIWARMSVVLRVLDLRDGTLSNANEAVCAKTEEPSEMARYSSWTHGKALFKHTGAV
jgi:hypothetical protein